MFLCNISHMRKMLRLHANNATETLINKIHFLFSFCCFCVNLCKILSGWSTAKKKKTNCSRWIWIDDFFSLYFQFLLIFFLLITHTFIVLSFCIWEVNELFVFVQPFGILWTVFKYLFIVSTKSVLLVHLNDWLFRRQVALSPRYNDTHFPFK